LVIYKDLGLFYTMRFFASSHSSDGSYLEIGRCYSA